MTSLAIVQCKKSDFHFTSYPHQSEADSLSPTLQKFFDTSKVSNSMITSIARKIYRQEKEKPFVEKFVKYAGYPVWDKSMTLKVRSEGGVSTRAGNEVSGTVIMVPFSLEEDSAINAILKVSLTKKDTSFKMLYRWQYNMHGYGKNDTANNAEKTALLFMGFEQMLFGHHTFSILDTMLFRYKNVSPGKVVINSFNKGIHSGMRKMVSISVCYQTLIWVPKNKGQVVGCPPGEPCNDGHYEVVDEECETYIFWTDDSPVGGSNEEATENPGGSGGNWSVDPCNSPGDENLVRGIRKFTPENPCNNPPGWEADIPFLEDEIYPPYEESFMSAIENNPFAFFKEIPCEVIKAWIQTAKHTVPQLLIGRLNSIVWKSVNVSPGTGAPGFQYEQVANVQRLDDAYSTVVNMDYFPSTVNQLPIIDGISWSPHKLLEYIRKNINNFVDTDYADFSPFHWSDIDDASLWYSANPLGAIVNIDIKGPNNGSVIVSGYKNDKWTFTTIYEPVYEKHPVSGNRDFGFVYNGNGSYTFYTRGVDRLTSADGKVFQEISDLTKNIVPGPFSFSDKLWESFQRKIDDFINDNGGVSIITSPQIHRPDYQKLKDVMQGLSPLSVFSKDCP